MGSPASSGGRHAEGAATPAGLVWRLWSRTAVPWVLGLGAAGVIVGLVARARLDPLVPAALAASGAGLMVVLRPGYRGRGVRGSRARARVARVAGAAVEAGLVVGAHAAGLGLATWKASGERDHLGAVLVAALTTLPLVPLVALAARAVRRLAVTAATRRPAGEPVAPALVQPPEPGRPVGLRPLHPRSLPDARHAPIRSRNRSAAPR